MTDASKDAQRDPERPAEQHHAKQSHAASYHDPIENTKARENGANDAGPQTLWRSGSVVQAEEDTE